MHWGVFQMTLEVGASGKCDMKNLPKVRRICKAAYRNIYMLSADPGLRSAGQDPGMNTKGFPVNPNL